MAFKTVTISSDHDLEKDIKAFLDDTGQSRAEFHRRSSNLYMDSLRKIKNKETQE